MPGQTKALAKDLKQGQRASRSTTRSTGAVVSVADATHVWVDIGARQVKATVPASVSGVAVGSQVLVRVANESVIEATLGGLARFRGDITADTALSSGFSRLTWTESRDDGGTFDATFFTAPSDGLFDFTVAWSLGTSSNRRFVTLALGTAAAGSNASLGRNEGPATGYYSGVSTWTDVALTAGQQVAVEVYAESALTTTSGLRPDLAPCFFSGRRAA